MILEISSWVAEGLFGAIVHGGRRLRLLFTLAASSIGLAIVCAIVAENLPNQKPLLNIVAGILGVIGAMLIIGIAGYQRVLIASEHQEVIKRVEERVREHPNEPQAAWELARIKLEIYLNRNLAQIRWIFFRCLLVITAGFIVIGYGTIQVYKSPDNFQPSIVVTLAGIIVEFIAATFLLIYKSTMEQARDYVNILERINAVGMSVQILESMESDDTGLRDKTRAEIAAGLLSLYGLTRGK